jgi:hypothetical protein
VREVLSFLEVEGVRSVAMASGLLGCPHEEGTAGRDRFTGEREQ